MAQSNGTKIFKVVAATLALAAMLSGCNIGDMLRPDLNPGKIRIFPNAAYAADDEMLDNGPAEDGVPDSTPGQSSNYWPGGSTSTNGDNTSAFKRYNLNTDHTRYKAIDYPVLSSNNYQKYLEDDLYTPLKELIESLENKDDLYVRVMHTGYTYTTSTGEYKQSIPFDEKIAGANMKNSCSGYALREYVLSWVGDLAVNTDRIEDSKKTAATKIDKLISRDGTELTLDSDIEAVKADGFLSLPYRNMMQNVYHPYATLGEFRDATQNTPYSAIPSLGVYVYSSASSRSELKLNETDSVYDKPYDGSIKDAAVEKVFEHYNQYEFRDKAPTQRCVTDTSSMLWSYIDGYNRTLIYVCTKPGEDLAETMGDSAYRQLLTLVGNLKAINRPDDIINSSSKYSGYKIVPLDTKGTA